MPAGSKHAGHLFDAGIKVADDRNHVAAPDEVERAIGGGDVLHHALSDLNALVEARFANRLARLLDETGHRIEADATRAGRPHQLDQIRPIATTYVEDTRGR